jgi:hypothetical protein
LLTRSSAALHALAGKNAALARPWVSTAITGSPF